MLKNKNLFINFLLLIWQIIQILVGLICLIIFRNFEKYTNDYNNVSVLKICHNGIFGTACFSTGPFIIVCKNATERILKHETGHTVQSFYFGPLFHIIISIPSITRFWYRRIFKKSLKWYNEGYPENWANKLGGVNNDNK